ncbi:MAG: exopolysaccharide biosynthesis protein, partial [Halofilum sp. (in: g-proteobacteria)]
AGDSGPVSLRAIIEELGSRSFGPLLLLAGLVILAPIIGDIPGVPTLMAIIVLLVAGQLLLGRRYLWLPRWLLERSVTHAKVDRALSWMRGPARFVDRLLQPRLSMFVNGPGVYAIALVCVVIAAATPPMEFVPFTANGAGLALTTFGLALIARDGLLALLAFVFTTVTLGAVAYGVL